MNIYYKLLSLIFLVSISSSALAQDINSLIPDFSPEEEANLGKAFGTFSSAITVFTGRNAASTGNFSFDDSDADFEITTVPLTYTFGEDGDSARFRLRGGFGYFTSESTFTDFSDIYSELESELPEELQGLPNQPDKRKDKATSVTLGGGVIFEPIAGLKIEPSFDFIWTHVKRKFEYNNFVSALLGLKYDRDLFNNSTESLSYSPSLQVDYEIPVGAGYTITPSVLYTHAWTHDLWSKSRFADFEIDSGVLKTKISSLIPLPFCALGYETALIPYVMRTELFGAVKNSLEENALYDMGMDLKLALESEWITNLYIGGAYITASDFDGYRIDLSADF